MRVRSWVVSGLFVLLTLGMVTPVASAAPGRPPMEVHCGEIGERLVWNMETYGRLVREGGSAQLRDRHAAWARYDAGQFQANDCGGGGRFDIDAALAAYSTLPSGPVIGRTLAVAVVGVAPQQDPPPDARCDGFYDRMSWNIMRHGQHAQAAERAPEQSRRAHERQRDTYAAWARYEADRYRKGFCGEVDIDVALELGREQPSWRLERM